MVPVDPMAHARGQRDTRQREAARLRHLCEIHPVVLLRGAVGACDLKTAARPVRNLAAGTNRSANQLTDKRLRDKADVRMVSDGPTQRAATSAEVQMTVGFLDGYRPAQITEHRGRRIQALAQRTVRSVTGGEPAAGLSQYLLDGV